MATMLLNLSPISIHVEIVQSVQQQLLRVDPCATAVEACQKHRFLVTLLAWPSMSEMISSVIGTRDLIVVSWCSCQPEVTQRTATKKRPQSWILYSHT